MSLPEAATEIVDGILLSDDGISAYPILDGVPVMLESGFTRDFLQKHATAIANNEVLSQISLPEQRKSPWSFRLNGINILIRILIKRGDGRWRKDYSSSL
jgi:hypothetical protein